MRCKRARRLLSDCIDQTLNIGLEERVRRHLSECPECASAAEEMRRTVLLLQGMARLETSPDFAANLSRHLSVAAGLARRPTTTTSLLGWASRWRDGGYSRRIGVLLAPAALGVGLAVYLWSADPPSPQMGVIPARPVISQDAYLASVAQEHAGYAKEHPLIDASAVSFTVTVTNAVAGR